MTTFELSIIIYAALVGVATLIATIVYLKKIRYIIVGFPILFVLSFICPFIWMVLIERLDVKPETFTLSTRYKSGIIEHKLYGLGFARTRHRVSSANIPYEGFVIRGEIIIAFDYEGEDKGEIYPLLRVSVYKHNSRTKFIVSRLKDMFDGKEVGYPEEVKQITIPQFEIKKGTHVVFKVADVKRYLDREQRRQFEHIKWLIQNGRRIDNKKQNDYYVVNTDELYADKVFDVIKQHETKYVKEGESR